MPSEGAERFVRHIESEGYHPRSSKHGDELCRLLLADLLGSCPAIHAAAQRGEIVYQLNYTIDPDSPDRWNTDLVIGPPREGLAAGAERIGPMQRVDPRAIRIAIDAKTIMTEHGKARRNRQRDLNSFQDILHRKERTTIVGGLVVVNVASRFRSPLRPESTITEHKNIERLVGEIVDMMKGLPSASAEPRAPGLEALGVIVVAHTNIAGQPSRLVLDPPAPPVDDPLSYTSFLRHLCAAYTERFGSKA
jgi:hypothetical protein